MTFPTDYREEFCEKVIEVLSQGRSIYSFAAEIGVCRQTVYTWAERNPAFDRALKAAKAASAAWWEGRALGVAGNQDDKGHPTMVIFGLKNRASDEWRDRTEYSGPEGGPVELAVTERIVRVNAQDRTDD